MPDFIAIVSATSHERSEHPTGGRFDEFRWIRWPWGWIGVVPSLWRESRVNDVWCAAAGRPHHRGGDLLDPSEAEAVHAATPGAFEKISGMFLLLRATDRGLSIVTDRFNHLPVYRVAGRVADAEAGVVLSSSVERISEALTSQPPIDLVSIAELILCDSITFPFTTRMGARELRPSSRTELIVRGDGVQESCTTLWEPREPGRWPSRRESIELVGQGLEEATAEITSSPKRIGVQLSGGLDSRIMLASLGERAEVEALTFLDEPNRESAAAQRVAATLGVKHHLVHRKPNFYADAFREGERLVGREQAMLPCHALCLAETVAEQRYDVLVGGFGCDILLKGAYIPYGFTQVVLAERGIKTLARSNLIRKHNYSHLDARAELIDPELVHAALARRDAYEQSLRDLRPKTAEEWVGFYPIRHTTSIDSMAMDRVTNHDEFYFHAGFVEASAAATWSLKKGLSLVSALGKRYAPEVARQPHPDTGLPATLTYLPARIAKRFLRRSSHAPTRSFSKPWYNDSSFISYAGFFEHSQAWKAIRDRALADSDATAALERVMTVSPHEVLENYRADGDPLRQAIVVQVLRLLSASHASKEAAA